ncbi:MAG: hypothetical protein IBJ16_02445, partial [Chitinophagaceae bacterium]|nr:hypothetical protein [Chitinophagaceae bacterium]
MQASNQHFKKKLFRLIVFAVLILGVLVIVLLFLQKTVEKHYTTEMEASPTAIELFKSPDEEHTFMEKGSNLSSIHASMIP